MDRESLENYIPPMPKVETVDGDRLQIFCADEVPPIGSAVAIEKEHGKEQSRRLYAVTERHLGARLIEAWMPLRPDWVRPGLSVQLNTTPAGFKKPTSSPLIPGADVVRPANGEDVLLWPTPPDWTELKGSTSALSIGIDVLDVLSPICIGGINLIIDTTEAATALTPLTSRVTKALQPSQRLVAANSDFLEAIDSENDDQHNEPWLIDIGTSTPAQVAALQFVIALAAPLRQAEPALAVVRLPELQRVADELPDQSTPPVGLSQIIDRLGRHLVSTNDASLTTVLHLHVPHRATGLADIIQSLNLGDVDATIHIDRDGRFDPERSNSVADVDDKILDRRRRMLQTLHQAGRAREKSTIFGEQELTDDEQTALVQAAKLRPVISSSLL